MSTNRQSIFLNRYSEIQSKNGLQELLEDFRADIQLDPYNNLYEVFIPSINNKTQAVMFYIDKDLECGYESSFSS